MRDPSRFADGAGLIRSADLSGNAQFTRPERPEFAEIDWLGLAGERGNPRSDYAEDADNPSHAFHADHARSAGLRGTPKRHSWRISNALVLETRHPRRFNFRPNRRRKRFRAAASNPVRQQSELHANPFSLPSRNDGNGPALSMAANAQGLPAGWHNAADLPHAHATHADQSERCTTASGNRSAGQHDATG
jgi:hypothetical protein